jgi:biotin synthase
MIVDHHSIDGWLRETREDKLEELWRMADQTRHDAVGDAVHLRGLIELSNNCRRSCGYCGLNVGNRAVTRYRMTAEEIIECAHQAVEYGYGTVVLQSGEDFGYDTDWLTDVIHRIKSETRLAITLSVGERRDDELETWRRAGADRYLLRFETSDPQLYKRIHPDVGNELSNRVNLLRRLREMGYEVGSGVMVGIPGQTYSILADDIELFRELDLDMIGVGPYIAHDDTELGREGLSTSKNEENQTPNTELMTYKVVALTRLACPRTNIPSTTALATLNKKQGREFGLQRGANIVMPNLTPPKYRVLYDIYPNKACLQETAGACNLCMKGRIQSIGRTIGQGQGASPNYMTRNVE